MPMNFSHAYVLCIDIFHDFFPFKLYLLASDQSKIEKLTQENMLTFNLLLLMAPYFI